MQRGQSARNCTLIRIHTVGAGVLDGPQAAENGTFGASGTPPPTAASPVSRCLGRAANGRPYGRFPRLLFPVPRSLFPCPGAGAATLSSCEN